MIAIATWFRKEQDGVTVVVRLTPRSASDAVEKVHLGAGGQTYLKVCVRAVPENGRANAALERLLAKHLGVAQRDVAITAGATSRIKQVRISGDPDELAARLAARD